MINILNEEGPNKQPLMSLPISDTVNALSLAADTAESLTIPDAANWIVFSATDDFYVNWTTTATVPGDTTDGSASELNPVIRKLDSGTSRTVSVISSAACVITAAFYD